MLEACINLEPGILEFEEEHLFDTPAPVDILGRRFSARSQQPEIRRHLLSRLWFTYRRGFEPIGGTGPRSDEGWGCMLRVGQMLLAEARIRLLKGPEWSWSPEGPADPSYLSLLNLFLDLKDRPYSLHHIAQMGVSEGKDVGQWFGPNTTAQVLKKLAALDETSEMVLHVALDNCLILSDVESLCASGASWRPLLLVVPLRLGLTSLNPCYISALKAFLGLESSLGLIGGRPNHALWVVGCVESEGLYLDPHHCQSHVAEVGVGPGDDASFHCPMLASQSLADLDPSLALAFLAPTADAFRVLIQDLRTKLIPASQPPAFEILERRPAWYPEFEPYRGPESTPAPSTFTQLGDSDEDFEILE